jgi:hypothetical protein
MSMTQEQVFRMVAEGAGLAEVAFSGPDAEHARALVHLVGSVANTAANLSAQGVADPAGHIQRVLDDEPLVAKAKDAREAALLLKFPQT